MRVWIVFAVIGLVISAGMVVCGIMLEHNAIVQEQKFESSFYPNNATVSYTSSPAPTPVQTHRPTRNRVVYPASPITLTCVVSGATGEKNSNFTIPKNYYHYPFKKCKPTYANLVKLLYQLKCPHKYDPRTFKCSHFAAWLEWYLENHGFKTDIVVITWKLKGTNPPVISGHAIDKVYTANGVVYVDPTILTIPWAHGRDLIVKSPMSVVPSNACIISVHSYHNIYDLMRDLGYYQIDWWVDTGYPHS